MQEPNAPTSSTQHPTAEPAADALRPEDNSTAPRPDLEAARAAKLGKEQDHLQALQRMRALDSYYRWTLRRVKPYLGQRVLDAGCGVGNFVDLVAPLCEFVMGIDLSPDNLKVARERFADLTNVSIKQYDLDVDLNVLKEQKFDTVVLLDVLEHVEHDVPLLQRLRDVVVPGGHLLLKVPAGQWMFGSIDRASDHYRRYSCQDLRRKSISAGWQPISCRYMNLAGVLPYYTKSVVLKKEANFSRTFKPWQLKLISKIVPALQVIDTLTGPPVGQSAVLVAKRVH